MPKQTEFLKNHGLIIDENRLAKLDSQDKIEYIKDAISGLLKEKLQILIDTISQRRKKGEDYFIEDLKLLKCKSKLKLALANYDLSDIQRFITLITELKKTVDARETKEVKKEA